MTTVRVRSRRAWPTSASVTALAAATLLVTACGTSTGDARTDGELTVVASTSVWGRVAEAVGGPTVTVRSIIDNNEADPHSYESTPRDAALVNDADLVVYNGGGYDAFVPQILSGLPTPKAVVEATGLADVESRHGDQAHAHGEHSEEGPSHEGHDHEGHGHSHEAHGHAGHGHSHEGNEHVWYQPHTVGDVARRVADELSRLQPRHAADFHRAAGQLARRAGELERQIDEIRAHHGGTEVLTTAPVSGLLLEKAGLVDITPAPYVQAVEAGNDPAAATIAKMHDAVESGRAAALIYNPQTASPLTERVRARAESHHIPVVVMSETPPADQSYTEWMSAQITALRKALEQP